jgi:hypothetical protein
MRLRRVDAALTEACGYHGLARRLCVRACRHKQPVPATVRVLDCDFGAEQVTPGSKPPVVVDKRGPLLGHRALGLHVPAGHVVIGLALDQPVHAVGVDGDASRPG